MTESRMILYRFSIFGEQKLFRGSILCHANVFESVNED